MPDALTSTFTAVNRQTRGDLPQLDGTNTTRFRPTYLRHAGPTSVKLPQIGWERTPTFCVQFGFCPAVIGIVAGDAPGRLLVAQAGMTARWPS